ncbi:NinE family protein [Pectobacterium parmentieri]|uniref:NinE family protein n=1 Tax=Pectobacterium parmentieri TaxID=1905730 RepID=UPI0018DF3AF2|nr:NinE family protein [Pectobacterium parmentieri]MBI0431673.1 NinE family protein [Pectobacterium parmentieri]
MSRQHSPTQKALDNLIFQPTRRSRNKPTKIPPSSQVTTYDHGYVLRKAAWDRTRARRMS